MTLKQMPIRFSDEERELISDLANLMVKELGESIEPTTAIRKAIKEALVNRGVNVPGDIFGKKQEGRPKEYALTSL